MSGDRCPGYIGDDGRCTACGSTYHCAQCGRASSSYGHYKAPGVFSCDPDYVPPVPKPRTSIPVAEVLAAIDRANGEQYRGLLQADSEHFGFSNAIQALRAELEDL